jgi:dinuclear metal center YbgI/SA1388 family protein
MTSLSSIVDFCNEILEPEKFSDYCKNGVQITAEEGGKQKITKIALGVSASKNFLEKSGEWGADLCICHHGIIFGKIQEIDDILRKRLQMSIENNMSIMGFHLPLDAHPEIGNNALICQKLGIGQDEKGLEKTEVGFTGNVKNPENFENFLAKTENLMGQKANFSGNFYEQATGKKVSRVCVISGGASKYSAEALQNNADTFIFGELSESSFHELKERNLNFIAAGHYATETFGIKALGEKIQKKFPEIQIRFIEEEVFI